MWVCELAVILVGALCVRILLRLASLVKMDTPVQIIKPSNSIPLSHPPSVHKWLLPRGSFIYDAIAVSRPEGHDKSSVTGYSYHTIGYHTIPYHTILQLDKNSIQHIHKSERYN